MKRWWIFIAIILLSVVALKVGKTRHFRNHRPEPIAKPVPEPPSTASTAANAVPTKLPPTLVRRDPADLPAAQRIATVNLKPRFVPPKEPLRIPPGSQLALSVKLIDSLAARANSEGQLVLHTVDASAFSGLGSLVASDGIRFRRIQSVSDDQIADLCRRAAKNTGEAQADLAAHVGIVAQSRDRETIISLARKLHALPEIEYAELASLDAPPPPPAADIAPVTPLLVANQTYREAANGVDSDFIWNTYGIRGDAGLKVTDCEYQYNPSHEDLSGLIQMQPGLVSMYEAFGDDHGTAAIGIIASGMNDYGTTGFVPDCSTWFYPEYSELTGGFQDRPSCITAAIATSASGDIVVLEMQDLGPANGTDYVPAEYSLSAWNAVKTGSNAGVIIVAAAGNGSQDLDSPTYSAYMARGDSGAIIVGGGTSGRAKYGFSTYGSRVNVQCWGNGVFTTGYGTHATYGSDVNQEYTSSFNGTSSATAVMGGTVALMQATAIRLCGIRLTPAEMRSLLVSTGRAQTGTNAATAPIGPLPDLQAATAALLIAHPPTFATLQSWGHFHFATATPNLTNDSDGDGLANLMEYLLGTKPTGQAPGDESFLPRISTEPDGLGGKRWVFEFHQPATRTGASWVIQSSADPLLNAWSPLVHGVNGITIIRSGDNIRATGPIGPTSRFLRLQASEN